jgi:hypothetical protein
LFFHTPIGGLFVAFNFFAYGYCCTGFLVDINFKSAGSVIPGYYGKVMLCFL